MNSANAEDQLRDYLYEGIVTETLWADEAYALNEEIVRHAEQIGARGFNDLFYSLQMMISDRQTLSITKMFDPAGGSNPTRSIPATLGLLERHARQWQLPGRQELIDMLTQAGMDATRLQDSSNKALTHDAVGHFQGTLPSLSATLNALRQVRNKVIAHNDAISRTKLQESMWQETLPLVDYAKRFVATIARAYLGTLYIEEWTTSEASRTSVLLRRLLTEAGIAPAA